MLQLPLIRLYELLQNKTSNRTDPEHVFGLDFLKGKK